MKIRRWKEIYDLRAEADAAIKTDTELGRKLYAKARRWELAKERAEELSPVEQFNEDQSGKWEM